MAHAQQQVLDRLQALLIAAVAAVDSRVYVHQVDPVPRERLPALLVDEDEAGESGEPYDVEGHEYRTLIVVIECLAAGGSSPAAVIDLGMQVEQAIFADVPLAGMASLEIRRLSSKPLISGEGDALISTRRQTWRFGYAIDPLHPDVFL